MKATEHKLMHGLVLSVFVVLLALALVPVVASVQSGGEVEAAYAASAKKYVGTYSWKSQDVWKGPKKAYSHYYVYVQKAKGSKITFWLYRDSPGLSVADGAGAWDAWSKKQTVTVKKGVAKFKWKDSFDNTGSGKLKFSKGKVKLYLKATHVERRGVLLEEKGKTGTKALKRVSKKVKATYYGLI